MLDTPYGNVEPVFEYFKELLLCHSVKVSSFVVVVVVVVVFVVVVFWGGDKVVCDHCVHKSCSHIYCM